MSRFKLWENVEEGTNSKGEKERERTGGPTNALHPKNGRKGNRDGH